MKKILSVLLICVLFLSTPSFVGAKETSDSLNEIKGIIELGIDENTQEKLLTKIQNGETIDSMK